MKKTIIVISAFLLLATQSCMKNYTCMCPNGSGGWESRGNMQAATKTEADRGCRAVSQNDDCTAEL